MLSYDLLPAVTLDFLRTGIPARDDAFAVQHENRVIDHAVDQQTEALFALCERLLVQLAVGEIAGDLRKTEQLAARIAKRRDDDARPEARAVLAHAPAFVLEAPFCDGAPELVLGPSALDR